MKTLILSSLICLSGIAAAADTATINRLPYSLNCTDAQRDGSSYSLHLEQMAFYRQDGKLYLHANIKTDAKDQIVSSYIDKLPTLIKLAGLNNSSNVKYKLTSISPQVSRLEVDKSYQIKLEIIGVKADDEPVDVQCAQ